MKNKILSIEICGNALRAVVVKRRSGKAVFLAFAEVPVSQAGPGTLQEEDVKTLLKKLGNYPKQAVLISSDVSFLTSELPIPHGSKLSSDKLLEAVKWEVQPYLSFNAAEGFFGYKLQTGSYKNRKTTPALITAMPRDAFVELSDICRKCGIKLQSVYAKENAFAFSVNLLPKGSAGKIIINVEGNSVAAALINREGPVSFYNAHLDSVETFASELGINNEDKYEVVVAGNQDDKVTDQLKGMFGLPVRKWKPQDDVCCFNTETSMNAGPQYASVSGAALHELGFFGKAPLGINGRISLVKKLKKKVHILPIAAVVIIAIGFLLHYGYIKFSFAKYSLQLKVFETEKKGMQDNASKLENLKTQISKIQNKKRYIEQILPAQQKILFDLFDGITRKIPADLILDKILYENDEIFLEGGGLSAGSITHFVMALRNLKAVKDAKIETISEKHVKNKESELFVYQFRIKIIL